jgi:hypothetical protein
MDELFSSLRDFALAYLDAGWHPLELPAGAKAPPPDGRTGFDGVDMTFVEVDRAAWVGNIGIRMPIDAIGIDVDAYRGGKAELDRLVAELGPLPNTWISHSGRNDGSGIRFFLVPEGMTWVTGLAGIDIIQRKHRYALPYPSIHPDGRRYGWWDQAEAASTTEVPRVEDLPDLPWAWIAKLSRPNSGDIASRAQAVDLPGLDAFIGDHTQADSPSYITGSILAHFNERTQAGYSRHDTMQHCLIWAMEHVRAGVAAAQPTIDLFAKAWVRVMDDPRRGELSSHGRTTEFDAMVRHAVGKANAKTTDELHKYHDDAAGITMNVPSDDPPALVTEQEEPSLLPRPIDWAEFATRDSGIRRWLVDHFWPVGRALALWAPAKLGKSELALWIALKLATGRDPWNGDPIEPIDIGYFDFEMSEEDLDERLAGFDVDLDTLGHLHYWALPAIHALDTEDGGKELASLAVEFGCQALVVDTFFASTKGEENESTTVHDFSRYTATRLKQLGIAYLRTDHAGHNTRRERGSSAKRGDIDVAWGLKRVQDGESVVLDCAGSSRLGWVGPSLTVDRVIDADGIVSYQMPVRIGWPSAVFAKAAQLDAIGFPLDKGRRAAISALKLAGIRPGHNPTLDDALEYRRGTCAQGVPKSVPNS